MRDGVRCPLVTSDESRTIVVQDSHTSAARREQAARFTAAAIRTDRWDLRSLGTSFPLPYVGAGRIAAYVELWATQVHLAAGSLLAAEAGAIVSDVDGRPWTVDADSIVVSANPDLHAQLRELVGG
jgi:myo-inositol-1(or 4)-monophosphatase